MRYFKDTTGQVHGYDEAIEAFEPYIEKAVAEGWQEITGSWPPAETQEQAQIRLSPLLTSAINEGAQSWGYDDIVSAASYLNSTNLQYVAEAKALIEWRDKVWAWAIPALASVIPGETAGQFLSGMPAEPVRPVI
jgi:hypothetical protein